MKSTVVLVILLLVVVCWMVLTAGYCYFLHSNIAFDVSSNRKSLVTPTGSLRNS